MFDGMIEKLNNFWQQARKTWQGMTGSQRMYAGVGAGVVALGFVTGGPLMQAVFTGLIFNTLLWMMLYESNFAMGLMREYGGKIDLGITLMGFLFGGGSGVTALMVGVVVGALFSVFRVMFCGIPQKGVQ